MAQNTLTGPDTSRRGLLAGAAAIVSAASIAPATASPIDPAVIAARAYAAAHQASLAADNEAEEIEDEAATHFAEVPEGIRARVSAMANAPGHGRFVAMTHDQIDRFFLVPPEKERRHALLATYTAECDAILARFGHPEALARGEAADDQCRRLLQVLRSTQATTVAGALAKIRLAERFEPFLAEGLDPSISYVSPVMLASAYMDLERLVAAAGLSV